MLQNILTITRAVFHTPEELYNLGIQAVNIRFEYNADGWLVKESMSSVGYNKNVASATQVSLEAIYVYEFGPDLP